MNTMQTIRLIKTANEYITFKSIMTRKFFFITNFVFEISYLYHWSLVITRERANRN